MRPSYMETARLKDRKTISAFDYLDLPVSLLKAKGLRGLNLAPHPRVIAYTVTWRCNASCDMCGVKKVDNRLKDKTEELDAGDISRIFKDRLLKRLDLIRFTGGEPFLKEDFADIAREILKNTNTKIYYVTTNGFFSEKIFDFVERLAPKIRNLVIQVSLDAVGEAHDKLRKVPGLYDSVIRTLQGLKELRERYEFGFGVNQTLTHETAAYIDEVSDLCRRFKCDHKVYPALEAHESDILQGEGLKSDPVLVSGSGRSAIRDLYERIEDHYKKEVLPKNPFLAEKLWRAVEKYIILGSKNRVLSGVNFPNPPCLALFFYFRLLPDGTVMPCTLKPRAIGNLKKETFTRVWSSPKARQLRAEIRNCKGCWVECDIVPNLVYSFDTVNRYIKNIFSG